MVWQWLHPSTEGHDSCQAAFLPLPQALPDSRAPLPPLAPSDLQKEMVSHFASPKVLQGPLLVSLSPLLVDNLRPKLSLSSPFEQTICVLLDP